MRSWQTLAVLLILASEPSAADWLRDPLGYDGQHALVVGISEYSSETFGELRATNEDAVDIAMVLAARFGFDVSLLVDRQPASLLPNRVKVSVHEDGVTTDAIRTAVGSLCTVVGKRDALLFFYSGHGGVSRNVKEAFLATTKSEADDLESMLPATDLVRTLLACDAHHTLAILDSCFSGAILENDSLVNNLLKEEPVAGRDLGLGTARENLSRVFNRRSFQVITAGGSERVGDIAKLSQDYADLADRFPEFQSHSPFTGALLQAMRGLTGLPDGRLLASDLGYYLTSTLVSDKRLEISQVPRSGRLGRTEGEFIFFPSSGHVLNPRLLAPLYIEGQAYAQLRRSASEALLSSILVKPVSVQRQLAGEAIPHLTRLLGDEQLEPRRAAVETLAQLALRLGSDVGEFSQVVRPIARLLSTLQSVSEVGDQSVLLLGAVPHLADEESVRSLKQYIDGERKDWQMAVVEGPLPPSIRRASEQAEALYAAAGVGTASEQTNAWTEVHNKLKWLREDGRRLRTELARRGERIIAAASRIADTDPTRAIALAFASTQYARSPEAVNLVRNAVRHFPAEVEILVEERRPAAAVEVFPSNFFGLSGMSLHHTGRVLVTHHLDGKLRVWSTESGEATFSVEDGEDPVISYALTRRFPVSLFTLSANGKLTQYRLRADGRVEETRDWQGEFVGLGSSEDRTVVVAWGYKALLVDGPDGTWSKLGLATSSIVAATPGPDSGSVYALTEKGQVVAFGRDREKAEQILQLAGYDASAPLDKQISLHYREELEVLLIIEKEGDPLGLARGSLLVVDVAQHRLAWSKELEGVVSVDLSAGKTEIPEEGVRYVSRVAMLGSAQFTQLLIDRGETGQLRVQQAGEAVRLMPSESEVGAAQAAGYGPHGEYLLTVNAPIMQNVGPRPATVKLWYANPYADTRVGDVHRGVVLGGRDTPVRNFAFDETGTKIALFSTDGLVRIRTVFPEQAIDFSRRAQDYFSGYYHLSVPARRLVEVEPVSVNSFLEETAATYRIRLSKAELEDLDAELTPGDALVESETLADGRTLAGSIALQQFETRDQVPNLARHLPPGYSPEENTYDPLRGNLILRELVSDIVEGPREAEQKLLRRYCEAIENDFLLLSGLQVPSLLSDLSSSDESHRQNALALLALAGDSSLMSHISRALERERSREVKELATWTIRILEDYGRDLSLDGTLSDAPDVAGLQLLVNAPSVCLEDVRRSLLVFPWDPAIGRTIETVLADNRIKKSLGMLAFHTLLSRHKDGFSSALQFAALLKAQGARKAAEELYRQLQGIATVDPEHRGHAENALGEILLERKEHPKALEWFRSAILAGYYEIPCMNLTNVLREMDRAEESARVAAACEQLTSTPLVPDRGRSQPPGFEDRPHSYDPFDRNEALTDILRRVAEHREPDDLTLLADYLRALEIDPILLTGLQVGVAKEWLARENPSLHQKAYLLMAMSGDGSLVPWLESTEADEGLPQPAQWAIEFLRRHGRDLSLSGIVSDPTRPQIDLLSVPTPCLRWRGMGLLGGTWDRSLRETVFQALEESATYSSAALPAVANHLTSTTGLQYELNLVSMLRDQGAYKSALARCKPLLDQPAHGRLRGQASNLCGYLLLLDGDAEASIRYFRRAIDEGRPDGWPERNWAEALSRLGREDEARRMYERAIQIVERGVEGARSRLDPAEFARLEEGTRHERAGFYNALAWHLVSSKDLASLYVQRARNAARTACDLAESQNADFLDTLAHAHAAAGDYKEAIATQHMALSLLSGSDSQSISEFEEKIAIWRSELSSQLDSEDAASLEPLPSRF